MIRLRSFLWMFLLLLTSPAQSADLTAEQVRGVLAAASRDKPANLSGRSLENLDLSNFDFKGANLSGANLFGAKLDSAELSGANLRPTLPPSRRVRAPARVGDGLRG
jgi:hypothetical protein